MTDHGFSLRLQRNDISPDLRKKIAKVKNAGPLLRAIGVGMVGLAKESFNNASLRPAPWRNKIDGTAATLKSREASLWRSIKVQNVTSREVKFGSDRPYAAIHQFGGIIRAKNGGYLKFQVGGKWIYAKQVTMPPRPYMPVMGGQLTAPAKARVKDIIEAYVMKRAA
jgi:phage gpG-like protein